MLHNRLSQLFQKESDRLLKSFLGENQDLLKKYVEGGVAAVSTVLKPVNSFMRHLLVVQGLDPDSIPGERQRLLTEQALTSFFDSRHEKDFDDDYDLSWVAQKFEKTRGALKDLRLTQDKFMELTDLSKMDSGRYPTTKEEQEISRTLVTPDPDKRELNIGDPIKDLVAELKKQSSEGPKHVGIKTTKKKLNKRKKAGASSKVRRVTNTEFKAQAAAKLARATELTNLMVEKDLCEIDDKVRQDQINTMLNMDDNNLDALERVIKRYKPSKDAVAENKFTGSFRRTPKK